MKIVLNRLLLVAAVILCGATVRAQMSITPWIPIFKGVDRAAGTNTPDGTIPNRQVANCVRVDLLDPDIRLLPTPPASNYIAGSRETLSMTVSNFLKVHKLAVVTAANFYNDAVAGDPQSDGIACEPEGLMISTGAVVSVVGQNRYCSLLFATNNSPFFLPSNAPPGTNLSGIYNAVSGFYPVITNGVVIGSVLSSLYPDPTIHQLQPRTIHGLSEDRRYLYLMIIDGRQSGYSDGANDTHAGLWALAFGMSDAINMDGGGSTAMFMANCSGNPVALGRSSYSQLYFHERYVGAHLGIAALPLDAFFLDVSATGLVTTATIKWNTLSNSTSQVEYGLTPGLGTFSPVDSNLVTNHTVTISGLLAGRTYYYRVLSTEPGNVQHVSGCVNSFMTSDPGAGIAFPLATTWKCNTANLDGVNWTSPAFDDSAWPQGPAVMWAYNSNTPPQNYSYWSTYVPNFATGGTRMPTDVSLAGKPFITYYFRKSFVFSNSPVGVTLVFSNFLDDAAVFYLNGTEVFRTNMPAGTPFNATAAPVATPCQAGSGGNPPAGNPTCPMVFTLSNSPALVAGTNVVSAEIHNFRTAANAYSDDAAFESALYFSVPVSSLAISNVVVVAGETNATIAWQTTVAASSQVQYGTNTTLDSASASNGTRTTTHFVTLTNLLPLTQYYFRLLSSDGGAPVTYDGVFSTVPYYGSIIPLTQSWRYTSANISAANWKATNYNDSAWPTGSGLFFIEDNPEVTPRNTTLPDNGSGQAASTYYFRTEFVLTQSLAGFALLFTNYIDDGAVFYLNGREVQRVRMAAGTPGYATLADGCPVNNCEATLDVPDIFRLSGDALTNVVAGTNVLAVEVHQLNAPDTDVVFGSSIGLVRALASETKLGISRSNNVLRVTWPGNGLTLQRADVLTNNAWSDVPGPVKTAPYLQTNTTGQRFFRLRD